MGVIEVEGIEVTSSNTGGFSKPTQGRIQSRENLFSCFLVSKIEYKVLCILEVWNARIHSSPLD